MLKIKQFINSVFNSNSYLIVEGSMAILIDIGDFAPILEYLTDNKLKLIAVLITHTHFDHIYGIKDLMTEFPNVPIYTSEFGKEAFRKSNWNFSRYHNDEIVIDSDNIKILKNRVIITILDKKELEVIATPGHDKSSLCFKIGNMLFTGDSYIPGIKVVASFPNSNKEEAEMWYNFLGECGRRYNIYPGHGNIKISNSKNTED